MQAFCTIITANYIPYAQTLYKSLVHFSKNVHLEVLICGDQLPTIDAEMYPGLNLTLINNLYGFSITDELYNKYEQHLDSLRWSLKPVYMQFLLNNGYQKIIFLDCDICFFNNYDFLFSQLDSHHILLTPHRTTSNPVVDPNEFLASFQNGMYNAGFIAASRKGIPALQWWAKACLFKNEVSYDEGIYKDQRYLDAMPAFFENLKIIDHRGCNIAFWNQHECKRTMVNGQLLINGKYPVVFVHFTRKYIPELLKGHDELIYPLFLQYKSWFEETGHSFDNFIAELPVHQTPNSFLKLKKKLLIRTRIKKWLFKLSQQ